MPLVTNIIAPSGKRTCSNDSPCGESLLHVYISPNQLQAAALYDNTVQLNKTHAKYIN